MERNPNFLHQKYNNLSPSPEVDAIAKRTAEKTGAAVSTDRGVRIQQYLDYLKDSLGLPDDTRESGEHRFEADAEGRNEKLAHFKDVLYQKYITKPENIPESYWKNQQRIAREQGHGDVDVTDETKCELTEVIVADQKSSLNSWIDYLASPDAVYPDWLKYYAFRSILAMAEYDKEKKLFPERNKGTTKGFPDINREALAIILDALQKKHAGKPSSPMPGIEQTDMERFQSLLQGESFPKLYAWAIEKLTPISQELLMNTTGVWKTYKKDSPHMPIVTSLQGHNTGWCTAGESVAEKYLKAGDLHVYYSIDETGTFTNPRAAICMKGNTISEVRGIAKQQNLDPYITEVVQQKLTEFPDGKLYEKKTQDMKMLTSIETKYKDNQQLTRDELVFLYEVDSPIQGFGYQKDPRVQEIKKGRDTMFDACIIFKCLPEQIAKTQQEITEKTKAYIGPLFKDIFLTLSHLEYIYTSFPEGRIRKENLNIGGKTKDQLVEEMKRENIWTSSCAAQMMNNKDFTTSPISEQHDFVRLTVKDMFGSTGPTTKQLYAKAQELGLELCPPETGPAYRLQYKDQPSNEWIRIGMKQIADAGGDLYVFNVVHFDGGLCLHNRWADPGRKWVPDDHFLFRIRNLKT